MSTIITHDMATGKPKIMIYAPAVRTYIHNTDITDYIIEIEGEAEKPFITAVRLLGCTIIADNMRAFEQCFFDDDCELIVKNMPKITHSMSTAETILGNRIGVDA